jgi:hypothetical protein
MSSRKEMSTERQIGFVFDVLPTPIKRLSNHLNQRIRAHKCHILKYKWQCMTFHLTLHMI